MTPSPIFLRMRSLSPTSQSWSYPLTQSVHGKGATERGSREIGKLAVTQEGAAARYRVWAAAPAQQARGVTAVAACGRAGKGRQRWLTVVRGACDFSRAAGSSKAISRFPYVGKAAVRRFLEGSKQGVAGSRQAHSQRWGILTQSRVKFLLSMLCKTYVNQIDRRLLA
jgi:hypothetical protein